MIQVQGRLDIRTGGYDIRSIPQLILNVYTKVCQSRPIYMQMVTGGGRWWQVVAGGGKW
jgi:hypothetical protein